MIKTRAGGILCHPTSFYTEFGIGDIGPAAHQFVDFLADSGCSLWQVLPLNPTGYGDSPYQCFSAFAGNPYLISPQALVEMALLLPEELAAMPKFPAGRVDYGEVIQQKMNLLELAFGRFETHPEMPRAVDEFALKNLSWVEDFALFMALKEANGGRAWATWEPALRDRVPETLDVFRAENPEAIRRQIFFQYLFFQQWMSLKSHAMARGVQIIGDVPIYIAHDSADVWAEREIYHLNEVGNPTVVAGVPPDYFSKVGQLWGNPIYRWEIHAASGFRWWIERMQASLEMVDLVRLDHFRGFAGYWEIPAGAENAVKGRWVPGPGAPFLESLKTALGDLPLIAEDLGEITPDVIELRDRFDLPGMKIFQFGFSGEPDHEFLPHTYPENCVAYTGTHDNETLLGWFGSADEVHRAVARAYLGLSTDEEFSWAMLAALWSSPARMVMAQMQDFLEIGDEGRMNLPSRPDGNWQWRMEADDLSPTLSERILKLSRAGNRCAS